MATTWECYGHSRSLPADQRPGKAKDALQRDWAQRCQATKDKALDPVDPAKGVFSSMGACNASCGLKCDLRSGNCGQAGNVHEYFGTRLFHPDEKGPCHKACLSEACNGSLMSDKDKQARCNLQSCGILNTIANAIVGHEINPINCENCSFLEYLRMIFSTPDPNALVECSTKVGNTNVAIIFLLFIWIGVLLY